MNSFSFKELDAWKLCRELRNEIWLLVKSFPYEEKHVLTDQMIRASRSATNNIAEGFGRFHFQENIQFCRVARGSLHEMLDHISCAYDCSYIDISTNNKFNEMIIRAIKVLNGYINFLKNSKDQSVNTAREKQEDYSINETNE